jgi:ABC-type Fe3+/spermidine/putrescine transport system ATPase subunit
MLQIKNLSVQRGSKLILDNLNLEINPNAITAIIGPSGCGKTTLFLALLGVIDPINGEIIYNENKYVSSESKLAPEERDFGVVFQDLALFPNLTVRDNILFGVESNQENKLEEMLELFDLKRNVLKKPCELSGGEKQRVAFARSLATNPEYLLLDETFSSLDPVLRAKLRLDIRNILKKLKKGCLIISHDLQEVNEFCDHVIVMDESGKITKTYNVN